MVNKFFNKDGTLTAYALACGYFQQRKFYNGNIVIQLDMPCPGNRQFDVKVLNYSSHSIREVWECFDSLTKARKFFNKLVHTYEHNQS